MFKIWKTIKVSKYKSLKHCVEGLKRKNIYVSPWIQNIVSNKKNKLSITKKKCSYIELKLRI